MNANLDVSDGAISLSINGDEADADHRRDPLPDRDHDGVWDGEDLCPDVPEGDDWSVFVGDGCPERSAVPVTTEDAGTTEGEGDAALDGTTSATVTDGGACVPAQPAYERCNGVDDDCDGLVDEDLGLRVTCTSGLGECGRQGVLVCGLAGATKCSGVAGDPSAELCNGLDDDCDGIVDEDLGLGAPCVTGQGACAAAGNYICGQADDVVCSAASGSPQAETCNGVDDDCDGLIDDGLGLGTQCAVGVGQCMRFGTSMCTAAGLVGCTAFAGAPATETCNGLDDDCDSLIDEDFAVGEQCTVGVGACSTAGTVACGPDGLSLCGAAPGTPSAEVCNGLDDDCNGQVDDGCQ